MLRSETKVKKKTILISVWPTKRLIWLLKNSWRKKEEI